MGNQIDIIAQLVKQKMGKEPYDYVLYDGDSFCWIETKIDSVTSQLIYFYNSEKVEIPKEEIINYFKNSDDYKWGEYKNYFVKTGYFDVGMIKDHYKTINSKTYTLKINQVINSLLKIEAIKELKGSIQRYFVTVKDYQILLHFIEKFFNNDEEINYER